MALIFQTETLSNSDTIAVSAYSAPTRNSDVWDNGVKFLGCGMGPDMHSAMSELRRNLSSRRVEKRNEHASMADMLHACRPW